MEVMICSPCLNIWRLVDEMTSGGQLIPDPHGAWTEWIEVCVHCTKYKIQETLIKVNFQMYNKITLSVGYFIYISIHSALHPRGHFRQLYTLEQC